MWKTSGLFNFEQIYEYKDGFQAVRFHFRCDDKVNKLAVIKSSSGNIFGGYTEQS